MTDKPPSQIINVYGVADDPAYQRTVSMRNITFTCVSCKQTVTQLRYPSPTPSYCSETCRNEAAMLREEERVRKQREKRQAERALHKKL